MHRRVWSACLDYITCMHGALRGQRVLETLKGELQVVFELLHGCRELNPDPLHAKAASILNL